MNDFFELIKLSASAWYVSYAVVNTDGPFGIFKWLRAHLPLGGLTTCIICLVVWVALAFRLIGANPVTDALAIAGVALWIHGFTSWRMNP